MRNGVQGRKPLRNKLLGVTIGMIVACGPASRLPGTDNRSITETVIAEETTYAPRKGREAGLHAYDGDVADYSTGGISRQIQMLEKHVNWLASAPYGSEDELLDLQLLRWQANEELFWLRDAKSPQKDPGFYDELFAVNGYLDRDYAPFDQRFRKLVEHEEQALEQIEWMYSNLKPPLPKPLVDVSVGIYEGFAEYLRGDVVKQTRASVDADLQRRFHAANEQLALEADKLVAWLKTVPTDQSHVLGAKRFERLVEIYAGQKMSLADFEKMGEEDLAKNKAIYEKYKDAPRVNVTDPLGDGAKLVDEAQGFITEHHIVPLPQTSNRVEVVETPPYLRYNAAWLDSGGPFEVTMGAKFYITPGGFIPSRAELRSTAVHEVYPGHFVQAEYLREAPTKVQKMVGSATFIEGWAHYAEQMMLDEGFGNDPDGRLGQVSQALLRDCRFLGALAIHAKGQSIESVEKRMMDDCHQDPKVAHQQALRGAFHPWYFAYTLGKLQILALRQEAKEHLGSSFQLSLFHYALLRHGQGPVGLIRKTVLAELDRIPQ